MFAAKYGRPLLKTELELLDFYIYFAESKLLKNDRTEELGACFVARQELLGHGLIKSNVRALSARAGWPSKTRKPCAGVARSP